MPEMELDREKIVLLIWECVLNVPAAKQLPGTRVDEELPLLGGSSCFDSIDLVTIIVDVEQKLAMEYDLSLTLASESAMSRRQSPFRTVGALADYVEELWMILQNQCVTKESYS